MKVFLPLLALPLVGAGPAEGETVQAGETAAPAAIETEGLQTPVIDPDADYRCDDDPLLVEGAEGDAELFRDPARPDAVQPMRAVDYQVNGCSLLVMTDGSLVRPEDRDVSFTLRPAAQ